MLARAGSFGPGVRIPTRFSGSAPEIDTTWSDARCFRIARNRPTVNPAVLARLDRTDHGSDALAGILLPDVLTYDTSTAANGEALNGRNLDDDVIDAELGITTNGCVTSDGAEAHDDYLSTFPYLGVPH